ncbi:MAG: 3' terminal RNA ribose 2'-O-methyltransferase Hen1 [Steroidobacteraceae bacterium]|nr:3' terminal RNA ribose 2'-O-methyltransferase Hen1 [Steroidobacteraceae bacterium]
MLLTISTTTQPATDLGFLLHKNPARVHRFEQSFGRATVFYPEATAERCTVCLLVDVDPVGLVRRRSGPAGEDGQLAQYVNDRPYVASSFLSVALSDVFGTAMAGRSKDRPELAATAIPLEVSIPVLPSRGGEMLIRELFEPLGYAVRAERLPLDEAFPGWGESRYFSVTLSGTLRLQQLLNHLYVLIPVLDDEKHYWVGDDEVEKLLRRGADWLPTHPAKEQIARRYLKHRKSLARAALERLTPSEAEADDARVAGKPAAREDALEAPLRLNEQRIAKVVEVVLEVGAQSVLDLGCGEGKLLRELLRQRQLERIVGVDVSLRALEIAEERLELDRLAPAIRNKLTLLHGSLMYRDRRLQGFDAATLIEVVEHLDAPRLRAFERVVFENARPATVILTTPNAEYNAKFSSLPAGQFRHPDHRFEWTRAEFERWAGDVATRFGYEVRFTPVGEVDAVLGPPTQMAIFRVR